MSKMRNLTQYASGIARFVSPAIEPPRGFQPYDPLLDAKSEESELMGIRPGFYGRFADNEVVETDPLFVGGPALKDFRDSLRRRSNSNPTKYSFEVGGTD